MTIHRCRRCDGEFERGYVQIHGTALGFLFVGWSYVKFFFKPDNGRTPETPFLGWRQKHVAYRCLGCGDMVVTPHLWT
jgi:DNA-directed RNA polymerase subunit RPC12/RpoP